MESRCPSVAAIAIIARENHPLHIALFPSGGPDGKQPRDEVEYSFVLNTCLDIFEARMPSKTVGHDFGLLHALDERIAIYGWLLNTGVKLVIIVDMEGAKTEASNLTAGLGLRSNDLLPAFQALQTAYVRLLRNPFYTPDDHSPRTAPDSISYLITSTNFIREVDRIGRSWYPGITRL